MRLLLLVPLLIQLVVCGEDTTAQNLPKDSLISILDNWPGRSNARSEILKLQVDPIPRLISVASSSADPTLRKLHAISLLATFKDSRTNQGLTNLVTTSIPQLRCAVLEALTEEDPSYAATVLVNELNDDNVCRIEEASDSGVNRPIYVSETASRLLTLIKGSPCGRGQAETRKEAACWRKWLEQRGVPNN